jgi:hypothetical protein
MHERRFERRQADLKEKGGEQEKRREERLTSQEHRNRLERVKEHREGFPNDPA